MALLPRLGFLPPIHPHKVFEYEDITPLPDGYTIHGLRQFRDVWVDSLAIPEEFFEPFKWCDEHPLPIRAETLQPCLIVKTTHEGKTYTPLRVNIVETLNPDEPDCECCGTHGALVSVARGGGEWLFASHADEEWNVLAAHAFICRMIEGWLKVGMSVSVEAVSVA